MSTTTRKPAVRTRKATTTAKAATATKAAARKARTTTKAEGRISAHRKAELRKADKATPTQRVNPKVADLHAEYRDVPTDNPTAVAATDRVTMLALAKDEWAALKAWVAAGAKAPRPATPNLDAVNQAHASGAPKAKAAKDPNADRSRSDLPVAILAELANVTTGDGLTPSQIGKLIGRSAGAVAYAMGYLVPQGKVVQVSDKPKRFRAVG